MTLQHVYEFYADDGTCLYVGCSGQPKERIRQHKSKPWWSEVARIESSAYPDLHTGLQVETERIQFLKPRYNKLIGDRPTVRGWVMRRYQAEERHARGEVCEEFDGCTECNYMRYLEKRRTRETSDP